MKSIINPSKTDIAEIASKMKSDDLGQIIIHNANIIRKYYDHPTEKNVIDLMIELFTQELENEGLEPEHWHLVDINMPMNLSAFICSELDILSLYRTRKAQHLYLFTDDTGAYKIGRSQDVEDRLDIKKEDKLGIKISQKKRRSRKLRSSFALKSRKRQNKMNLDELSDELIWLRYIATKYFNLINLGKLKGIVNLIHIRKYKLEMEVA